MQLSSSGLAVWSLALLLLLAGCGGTSDTPTITTPSIDEEVETETAQTTATATPFEPSVADTDQDLAFLDHFRGRNLDVSSVQTRNGTVHVRYEALDGSERREQAAFFLALAYGSVVNDTWSSNATWNASRMDAVAVGDEQSVARQEIPAYWGRQVAMEEMSPSQLAARLRNASANLSTPSSSLPERSRFRENVSTGTDATVLDLHRTGRTAFLTIETETTETALAENLRTITAAYGSHVDGWNTTALEVTIRGPDGDLYGWYRVDSAVAADVANGTGSVPGGVPATVYREGDNLEPSG